MRMIPSQPLGTHSQAELRVFDQLRSAFSGAGQNGWFALHSLNLPRHEYKRFGEIDFVVCGPGGLFVLEVKGGRVSCHEGVWETTNRYDEIARLRESPFRQAETALHGLCKKLPAGLSDALVVGYGVVMPDSRGLPQSAEWDREVLADARDFKQFQQWLERLVRYWRAKAPDKADAVPAALKRLQRHLRPDFEAVVPLRVSAGIVEDRIARLTEDQLRLIDVVEVNPRVLCYGGAGTGKTFLAIELARRWAAAGKQTALVCHSPWLKHFLERHSLPGLTISLAASLPLAARRAGVDRFDALIVDEGQDILNLEALDRLDGCLHGGIQAGQWCFFHDANNQSGLCGAYEHQAYDYLESLCPVRVPLRTNCRNALPILRRIQEDLQADLGNPGVGDGPAVRVTQATDRETAIQALEQELRALLDREGFEPGDIVLLSPLPYSASLASVLPGTLRNRIAILDASSSRKPYRDRMGFARIADFKGLESDVVVLIDMPRPGADSTLRPLHYVGMSRARALLSLIHCG